MVEDELNLSDDEQEELDALLKGLGSPKAEEKSNVHTFLNKVATSKDTLKTGNLTEDEVGVVRLPVRSVKDFELMARELCEDDILEKFYGQQSEIITASSLSKDAKLISLAVLTEKRSLTGEARPRRRNSGWFGSRKSSNQLSDYQTE